ncbi:histidinol-phosphate transaminase [Nitrosomonas halophila]|jgi:histidinol-phosphate aminotransferase|uniref:Histidinol-phosphate aminotransferase n=1 Tax=Nitrosomonas halophila TaxID=44576 RepID=A0A1H3E628_9PROT|nr:histidinol-phosphate transaminase [Nitrosomonas halophila]SDX74080.1 histidinol-phosphate aminotransferase [Nitrosomonas halophila]
MNLCELAPEYIRAIQPYRPGKPISELVRDLGLNKSEVIKLASNENPLGTSPLAKEAMIQALSEAARYPDGSGYELKEALSERLGVSTEQIVLGNGSNDVLELAARIFLRPGAAAIYSQYAFAIYPLLAQAVGATGIRVPARDFGHDLAAMLDAITPETRIVFIANPNNPTGTLCEARDLLRFMERVSQDVLVILDEAYDEYLPEANKANSIAWLKNFQNLVITRTFSKAYGLASVRVGFALAHTDLANLMNRIRQPFNVNSIGLAGALAALQDVEFVKHSYTTNRTGMLQMTSGLRQLGIEYIPSYGNFVSFHISGNPTNGLKVYKNLLQQGVIVRPLGNYDMPNHLRVTIGLEAENKKFLFALEQALKEIG